MAGSGGWEQWEWDESLFAGAAGYYERGRLSYAPGLADALAHDLGLDGSGRMLDVGCGPGTVARRLAPGGAVVQVDAPGSRPARTVVPDGREIDLSVDQIVAGRFSNSGTAPHLFGERIGEFESDLRSLLADTSSLCWFSVRLPDSILRIWRPA